MPPATATPEDLQEMEREAGAAPPADPPANGAGPDEDHDGGDGGEPAAEYPEASSKAPEIEIKGSDQLTFAIGGKKPTSAAIKLVGGKVGLADRQYAKGEIVRLEVEAQVVSVAFVDKVDGNTGTVTATERQHKARVIGVVELEPTQD